jgi:hypothetical protein
MTNLINHIANKDYESANKSLEENFKVILEGKLHEMKKMCAAAMEQNTHAERQKRLRMDVIEEDDIDEGLLKVARDKLKLKSLSARANASERPVMKNIEGKPLVRKIQIKPKNLEEEDASEESSMARSELRAITKDAKSIMSKIKGNKELEAWTQSKITKAADYMNAVADYMEDEKEETEQLDEAPRVGVVKLRVRGGKVERRKKVSNVPGMTLRGGKLTRMSPAERRRRKLGAIKAARKTKTKKSQIMRKRKISLMKRARLGG